MGREETPAGRDDRHAWMGGGCELEGHAESRDTHGETLQEWTCTSGEGPRNWESGLELVFPLWALSAETQRSALFPTGMRKLWAGPGTVWIFTGPPASRV